MHIRYRNLTQLLKEELENSSVPAKVVAAEMGMPYASLMARLDTEHTHVFRADDLLVFMQSVRTLRPLEFLAREMGFRLEAMQTSPDGRNMEHECVQACTSVAAMVDAIDKDLPFEKVFELLRLATKEIEDAATRHRNEQLERTRCK